MNEFIQSIERMKDMPIVRFFSQFFDEQSLSPLFGRFDAGLTGRSPGALARELVIWAIVLALGTFIIDQVFYWTKPGKIEQARDTLQNIKEGTISFGQGVKSLALRVKDSVVNRREAPRGRR